jgi:outer membrane protein assembly factor BamB
MPRCNWFLVLPALVSLSLVGADWPLFRGDARQTGIAKDGLPEQLAVLWKFETKDNIEATAVIVDGVVYIGSMDEHLYAIDLKTGKEKWNYKGGPFKASASVRGDAVYAGDQDGVLHCIDAATGKKRWTFTTDAEITSAVNFSGDSILFGSYDENLYCLTKDGNSRWKFKINGPINGSPAVVDGKTFVAGCDSMLHVIDVEHGKELRSVDLGGQVGATAAVAGDRLFVGTMTNEVLAIDWKKGEIDWKFQAPTRQQPFYSSAAITDDLALVGSRDRRLWALDRKTGKEAWSFLTDGRVDASPVVVGKRVYIPSLDGKLYVLDAAKGTLLTKYTVGGQVSASPAVAGDRLVIGNDQGIVYCFGPKP